MRWNDYELLHIDSYFSNIQYFCKFQKIENIRNYVKARKRVVLIGILVKNRRNFMVYYNSNFQIEF